MGENEETAETIESALNDSLGLSTQADQPVVSEKKETTDQQVVEKKEEPADQKVAEKTFSKVVEKEPEVVIPKKVEKYPEVTEDDYSIDDNGKIVVKAQHILDDIETIIEKDVSVFGKIYNKKGGSKKAEVIAKALGFKGDSTRNASQVARDTFRAWSNAVKKGDEEKASEIYDESFPSELKEEGETNYVKSENIVKQADVLVQKPKKQENIKTPIESFIQGNLHKFVDSSFTKEDVEKTRNELVEKLMDSPTVYDLVSKERYNSETGKKLSIAEKLEYFSDKILKDDSIDIPKGGGAKHASVSVKPSDDTDVDNMVKMITGK